MLENVFVAALLIFLARVLNITLATMRTLVMTRGLRVVSAVLGFFEALIFAVVISQVVQDLGNVWNLVSYSAGFAGGILVGLTIEQRLAMGYATLNIVSSHKAHEVAEAIRQAGFGATESWGHGSEGRVGLVRTVVNRREVSRISDVINKADPASFVTIEETRSVWRGHLGMMQTRS